jgi:hypothetical protein
MLIVEIAGGTVSGKSTIGNLVTGVETVEPERSVHPVSERPGEREKPLHFQFIVQQKCFRGFIIAQGGNNHTTREPLKSII